MYIFAFLLILPFFTCIPGDVIYLPLFLRILNIYKIVDLPFYTPFILSILLYKQLSLISFNKVWISLWTLGIFYYAFNIAYWLTYAPNVKIIAFHTFAYYISPIVTYPISDFNKFNLTPVYFYNIGFNFYNWSITVYYIPFYPNFIIKLSILCYYPVFLIY